MPVFYHLILNVNSNESRQSVLANLPGYPDLAIVCVHHIKDWDEPEGTTFCELPQLLLDASELWVASVS